MTLRIYRLCQYLTGLHTKLSRLSHLFMKTRAPSADKGFPSPAVHNGHIKRITDPDIQSTVLEIASSNITTTYITCPADPQKTLGIKLPFLVMIVKNLKKYFSFEVQVLDDKNVRRRFRASNYQASLQMATFLQEFLS